MTDFRKIYGKLYGLMSSCLSYYSKDKVLYKIISEIKKENEIFSCYMISAANNITWEWIPVYNLKREIVGYDVSESITEYGMYNVITEIIVEKKIYPNIAIVEDICLCHHNCADCYNEVTGVKDCHYNHDWLSYNEDGSFVVDIEESLCMKTELLILATEYKYKTKMYSDGYIKFWKEK